MVKLSWLRISQLTQVYVTDMEVRMGLINWTGNMFMVKMILRTFYRTVSYVIHQEQTCTFLRMFQVLYSCAYSGSNMLIIVYAEQTRYFS